MSVSTDGKILFWRQSDQLKHPIRGYLLSTREQLIGKAVANPLNGTCLEYCADTQSLLVGSISGALWKIGSAVVSPVPAKKGVTVSTMKWTSDAAAIRDSVTEIETKREIVEKVERHCKDLGIKEVDYEQIFESKIDLRALYPCPSVFAYESHSGPVYSIKSSPFQRNIFVTCSADGSIRLYDQQQRGYLLQIEPEVTCEVLSVDWSPVRPTAFMATISTGEGFMYDVRHNRSAPIVKVAASSKVGATSVKFNGRLTGFVATGYESGSVNVYKLNKYYSVGTVRPEEFQTWRDIIEEENKA